MIGTTEVDKDVPHSPHPHLNLTLTGFVSGEDDHPEVFFLSKALNFGASV